DRSAHRLPSGGWFRSYGDTRFSPSMRKGEGEVHSPKIDRADRALGPVEARITKRRRRPSPSQPAHEPLPWIQHPHIAAGLVKRDDGVRHMVTGRHAVAKLATPGKSPTAAGLSTDVCNHTFRGTGITTYLENGGTLEKARQMAAHASTRTTQLYDRREVASRSMRW